MLMNLRTAMKDERGSTIVELLVGMAMGMIVLSGLSMLIITTLHGNARVDARVEATQNARLTVTNIMEQLHSACVSPQIAPVKQKSTGTKLIFWHSSPKESTKVAPLPIESEIAYENGNLYETDKPNSNANFTTKSIPPSEWTFGTGVKRLLIEHVTPATGKSSIFNYYRYEKGGAGETALTTPLNQLGEEETVLVSVELEAEPRTHPVKDNGSDTIVTDQATLRLTPPSFNEEAPALPCQ
jgi:hypothetical protein